MQKNGGKGSNHCQKIDNIGRMGPDDDDVSRLLN